MLLRQPNNGPIVKGTNDGDTLVWDATRSEWFPGPGGGVRMTSVRFADVNAPAGGNGSIGRPFNTIQAAVDSFGPTPPVNALVVASAGDYSLEGTIALGAVSLTGWLQGADRGFTVAVAALTCSSGGSGQTTLNGIFCAGTVTFPEGGIAFLIGVSSFIAGNIGVPGDVVNAVQGVDFTNSAIFGDINTTGSILLNDCEMQSQNLRVLTTTTAGTQIQCTDITWLSIPTFAWPNAGVETLPGNVTCDGFSAQPLYQAPATLTHAQIVVLDNAQRATVNVTVPAVAAGNVGYANVDLTGTLLETMQPNDPVLVNPHSDLAAAGAGGGFINARMTTTPAEIRLAFIGPLAGGDALFTVSRQ